MSRNKIYWACQLAGWGLYCLLGLMLTAVFQGAGQLTFKYLQLQVIFIILMIGSTHLLRLYMKRKNWLVLSFPALLARLFPSLLLIALLTQGVMWLVMVYVVQLYSMEQTSFTAYLAYVFYIYIILLLWASVYLTVSLIRQRQQQEVDKWKLEAALKDTELQALKAQINPHFVFNSLNNIRSMIAEDQEQAR